MFAKCPLPGTSKTRLSALLGADGAASLARAMLSDILVSLSESVSLRMPPSSVIQFMLVAYIASELSCLHVFNTSPINTPTHQLPVSHN